MPRTTSLTLHTTSFPIFLFRQNIMKPIYFVFLSWELVLLHSTVIYRNPKLRIQHPVVCEITKKIEMKFVTYCTTKSKKNTVEIVRYSTTSTASNLLITVKFQIQSLVSTQGHNDKFISGGAFSSVLSLRFTPSFSSPYISFTSKWPLKFSQDIWGALLASAAPSQSGKNDICSHQTRSMGSKYNQECVCGWAPCLLAANIVIFSVKLNTKIKADVVVSECTVCYHVVAY